jgi:hypothetical protein
VHAICRQNKATAIGRVNMSGNAWKGDLDLPVKYTASGFAGIIII